MRALLDDPAALFAPLPLGDWQCTPNPAATQAPVPVANTAAAVAYDAMDASYRVSDLGYGGVMRGSPAPVRPRPLFVHIHGGSWQRGTHANEWRGAPAACRAAAAAGCVAVAVSYRLSDPPLPQAPLRALVLFCLTYPPVAVIQLLAGGGWPPVWWFLLGTFAFVAVSFAVMRVCTGGIKHPAHVTDCSDALAWVWEFGADIFPGAQALNYDNSSAARSGSSGSALRSAVDTSRIVLSGHSAGGHLASLALSDPRFLDAAAEHVAALRLVDRSLTRAHTHSPHSRAQAQLAQSEEVDQLSGSSSSSSSSSSISRSSSSAVVVAAPTADAAAASWSIVGPARALAAQVAATVSPALLAEAEAAAAAAPFVKTAAQIAREAEAMGPEQARAAAAARAVALLRGRGDALRAAVRGIVCVSGVYSLHKPVCFMFDLDQERNEMNTIFLQISPLISCSFYLNSSIFFHRFRARGSTSRT
mgnify:CR=1 FL=1